MLQTRRAGRRARREKQVAATRKAILDEARKSFAAVGYEDSSVDAIAARAGLTKSPIYHHFDSKRGLLKAVYEQLAERIEVNLQAGLDGLDPTEKVVAGVRAMLDNVRDPEVRRIMIEEGPYVLGSEAHEIDHRTYLGLVERLIVDLQAEGFASEIHAPTLARLLLRTLVEGSEIVGQAGGDPETRERVEATLMKIIFGLMH